MTEHDPWQAPARPDAANGNSPAGNSPWSAPEQPQQAPSATTTATTTTTPLEDFPNYETATYGAPLGDAPPSSDWSAPWLGANGPGGGQPGEHPWPAHAPKPKRKVKPVALIAVVALAAGAVGAGIAAAVHGGSSNSSTPAANIKPQTNNAPLLNGTTNVPAALAKIEPSVVLIKSNVTTQGGFGGVQQGTAAGTGIIISKEGEVVTNAHVVAGATQTQVTIPGQGAHSATVLGSDPAADLAVLKVDGVSNLTPATWAAQNTVQVGESAIAVGNAEGYGGTPSVSLGIVSALNRSISDETSNLTGLIQTDAAINPGNSGGPLVDAAGRVIGITTAVERGSSSEPAQGIGFAIPSDTVLKNIPGLEKGNGATGGSNGSTANSNVGYLGVNLADGPTGPVVTDVQDGSPAATAGLQVDDVIQKVDNTTVSDPDSLTTAIRSHKPGDTVTLTIVRDGSVQTVRVTLAKRPGNG
jgi:putative serine protease PepD